MTLARVAVSTWLLAGLAQVPPTTSQRTWPPPGVLSPGDDVSAPEIVSRVAPDYPPQLQIRRLQGFVTLQFVVEPDGTVGPVRVVAPLDVYLDGAAVAAVRQWRFKPGTKNGLAVRVAAQAVMTFTLRGEPPPMTLPEGFASGGDTSIAVWNDETVETTDTTIRLAYPAGWRRAASSSTAVTVADPHSMHSFGVMRPMTLPVPLPFPMPLNELARFSECIE
jgi:TonB family protein